jgi:hypothetical protein
VRRLIEFATSFSTLYPGDVITLECPLIGRMDVAVRAHQA